ncbi:hypothetical protein ACVJGD_005178 [Bradyrhizobium sp. USDA 10063]
MVGTAQGRLCPPYDSSYAVILHFAAEAVSFRGLGDP